jgi:hypothetical protein
MTIHTRQIQLTKMHIRKTTPSVESTVYIVSNVFLTILHTCFFFTPSFTSHHFTTHIYPSHYTPLSLLSYAALHYTSLHFTSLHFFILLGDFHFTSSHYTFKWFSAHIFFCLTHVNNRFLYPLFQSIWFAGESS